MTQNTEWHNVQGNYDEQNTVSQQANQPVVGSRESAFSQQQQSPRQTEDQASTQQQMNYQAQQGQLPQQQPEQQRNMGTATSPARPPVRTLKIGDQEIPYYPAPVGHATTSVTRLGQRARKQEREQANPGIPAVAQQDAVANARYVPMPAGGMQALAELLHPDDINDQEKMDNHIFDLLTLNRGIVTNDTMHTVGQMVRVPGV